MNSKNDFETLLDRKEAAHYLGLSPGTLAVLDCTGRRDFQPIKLANGRVLYRRSHLNKIREDQLKW